MSAKIYFKSSVNPDLAIEEMIAPEWPPALNPTLHQETSRIVAELNYSISPAYFTILPRIETFAMANLQLASAGYGHLMCGPVAT